MSQDDRNYIEALQLENRRTFNQKRKDEKQYKGNDLCAIRR